MSGPKILSVDDILGAPDLAEDVVEVPEWDGAVKVKGLTRGQTFELRKKAMVNGTVDLAILDALMVVAGVTEPKFSEDQAYALMQKAAGAVDRVSTRIAELSGMTDKAAAAADRSFPS